MTALFIPIKETQSVVRLPGDSPCAAASSAVGDGASSMNPSSGRALLRASDLSFIRDMLKREVCRLEGWLGCALAFYRQGDFEAYEELLQDADSCSNALLYSNADVCSQPLHEVDVQRLDEAAARERASGLICPSLIDVPKPLGWLGDWRVRVATSLCSYFSHNALLEADFGARQTFLLRATEWERKVAAAAGLEEARRPNGSLDALLLKRKDPELLSLVSRAVLLLVQALQPPTDSSAAMRSRQSPQTQPATTSPRSPSASPESPHEDALRRSADVQKALELFRVAAANCPTSAAPLLGLAACAVYQRRWSDALVFYARLVAFTPVPSVSSDREERPAVAEGEAECSQLSLAADLRYAMGVCFLRLNRRELALAAFRRALALKPLHSGALAASAVLAGDGLSAESLRRQTELLTQAHEANPADAAVLLQLAARFLFARRMDVASRLLQTAKPPACAWSLLAEQRYLQGILEQTRGRTEAAAVHFAAARRLRTEHAPTVLREAEAALAMGNPIEARAKLQPLIPRGEAPSGGVARLLGCALVEQAQIEAQQILQAALEAERNFDASASALRRMQLFHEEALDHLRRASAENPDCVSTHLAACRCHEALLLTKIGAGLSPAGGNALAEALEAFVSTLKSNFRRRARGRGASAVEEATAAEASSILRLAGAFLEDAQVDAVSRPPEFVNNFGVLLLEDRRLATAQRVFVAVASTSISLFQKVSAQEAAQTAQDQPQQQPRKEELEFPDGEGDEDAPSRFASLACIALFNLALALLLQGAHPQLSFLLKFMTGSPEQQRELASRCKSQRGEAFQQAPPNADLFEEDGLKGSLEEVPASAVSMACVRELVGRLNFAFPSRQLPWGLLLKAVVHLQRGCLYGAYNTAVSLARSERSGGGGVSRGDSILGCLIATAALTRAGRFKEAVHWARRALEIGSGGRCKGETGREGHRTSRKSPSSASGIRAFSDVTPLSFLASLHFQRATVSRGSRQKLDEAFAALRSSCVRGLLPPFGGNAHAALGLGVWMACQNLTRPAIAAFRRVLESSPSRELRGAVSFNLGLLGTALALTARADIVPGQDVAKADPLKLNKAYVHFLNALEATPTNIDFYLTLARLFFDCRYFRAGIDVLQVALQRWPNEPRLLHTLTTTLLRYVLSMINSKEQLHDAFLLQTLLHGTETVFTLASRLRRKRRALGPATGGVELQVQTDFLPFTSLNAFQGAGSFAASVARTVSAAVEGSALRGENLLVLSPTTLGELPEVSPEFEKDVLTSLPHITKLAPFAESKFVEDHRLQQERRRAQQAEQRQFQLLQIQREEKQRLKREREVQQLLEEEAKAIAASLPLRAAPENKLSDRRGKQTQQKKSRRADDDFIDDSAQHQDGDAEVPPPLEAGEANSEDERARERKRKKKEKKEKKERKKAKKARALAAAAAAKREAEGLAEGQVLNQDETQDPTQEHSSAPPKEGTTEDALKEEDGPSAELNSGSPGVSEENLFADVHSSDSEETKKRKRRKAEKKARKKAKRLLQPDDD